jgi:hypothetical protein
LSVGLYLLARVNHTIESPDELLQRMEKWVHSYAADLIPSTRIGISETSPTLFCQLHPAAEEVEFSILDALHLTASANTSAVGPGYHLFVSDLLKALARDFALTWIDTNPNDEDTEYLDESGYFFSGEQQRVFHEMTTWLRFLAESFFNGTFGDVSEAVILCMKMGEHFDSDELAITPLGPRDREWLLKTSEDGEAGKDFFAWWAPGLNAEYFLNRALTQMWSAVRWRKPINDKERGLLGYIINSLAIAHNLDPRLNFPWTEWAELLDYLDEYSPEYDFVRSRATGPASIGYRRNEVRITMPGYWSIKIPGSFSEFEMDEDCDSYSLDPPREVWFTSYNSKPSDPQKDFETERKRVLQEKPEFVRDEKNFIAHASIKKKSKDGQAYFTLSSSSICPAKRAVCTVVFTDPVDKDWALGVWRSIEPPKA